jgi:uncharacterized membrane protein YdbT with pleckstrin-like domain
MSSETNSSGTESHPSKSVLITTTPALRPTIVLGILVLITGLSVFTLLIFNPEIILGEPILTRIAWNAVALVTVLITFRLIIRIIVLQRTEYTIRGDKIIKEVDPLFWYQSREILLEELRGYEYSQNAIQRFLGYGNIQFLTAGTNQSIGFLEFVNLPDSGPVRDLIDDIS